MKENDLLDGNSQSTAAAPCNVKHSGENGGGFVFHLSDVLNDEALAQLSKEKKKMGNNTKKTRKVSRNEKKKTWILTLVNLLALLLFVILVPFLALRYLDSYSLHNQYIEVPDIYKMSIDEGKDVLNKRSLGFEIVGYEYTAAVPSERVIKQDPVAHARVKDGRVVKVVLSTGEKPTIPIPDVVDNSSRREAEDRLASAGFVVSEPVMVKGEKDWVYGVLWDGDSLSNGNRIPMGSTVTLVVGEGEIIEETDSLMGGEERSFDDIFYEML